LDGTDPSQDDEKNTFAWSTAAHLTNLSVSFSSMQKIFGALCLLWWMMGGCFGVSLKEERAREENLKME